MKYFYYCCGGFVNDRKFKPPANYFGSFLDINWQAQQRAKTCAGSTDNSSKHILEKWVFLHQPAALLILYILYAVSGPFHISTAIIYIYVCMYIYV